MEQQTTSTTDAQPDSGETTESQSIDAILVKVAEMMKSGHVDLEEIKMDLEDLKSAMNGENQDQTEPQGGMSRMIDNMQGGNQ